VFGRSSPHLCGAAFLVTIHDTPQRLSGAHVTSNFFSLLGVKPALGRDFTESDNQPGVERVTIISDALIMVTRSTPGWLSDSVKSRPRAGLTPRREKKLEVT